MCCVHSNVGAVAAERAQVQREYMLRKQEALANRARGVGGVLSPYVSHLRHLYHSSWVDGLTTRMLHWTYYHKVEFVFWLGLCLLVTIRMVTVFGQVSHLHMLLRSTQPSIPLRWINQVLAFLVGVKAGHFYVCAVAGNTL